MTAAEGFCRRHRSSYDNVFLPEEVIEQIIARVPCIKSILRCTSVCKSWYAFIHSTPFINFHLSLIPNNNNITKSLFCEHDEAEYPSYFIIGDDIESFHESNYFARHHDHTDENFQGPYFALHNDTEFFHEYYRFKSPTSYNLLQLHACNGLVCFNTAHDPNTLYLWNPVINKFKQLPLPLSNHPSDHSVFKLWFDSETNDYKILRISYTTKTCTVQVYTLATNSWNLITHDAPVTTSFLNSNNRLAYVNGIFYWPAFRDGNWTLISLDLKNCTFRERLTTWPSSRIFLRPSGDDNSLVILGYGDREDAVKDFFGICSVFQVYDHSLEKFYTINVEDTQRIYEHQPLGFRNNGELLFQNTLNKLEIVSYSLETKEFRELVPTTSRRLLRTIPFVETLALFNDADATWI